MNKVMRGSAPAHSRHPSASRHPSGRLRTRSASLLSARWTARLFARLAPGPAGMLAGPPAFYAVVQFGFFVFGEFWAAAKNL